MKKLDEYSAVIFDFDGTLVDSLSLWQDIDRIFLGSRGYEVPPDLHEAIAGMSFEETAEYFRKRFCRAVFEYATNLKGKGRLFEFPCVFL